jgi:SAM-dependent methyltransferase
MLHPQPTESEILSYYAGSTGHDFADNSRLANSFTEQEAARAYTKILRRHKPGSRMLLIAPKEHPFIRAAERKGFVIDSAFDVREFERISVTEDYYDCAVVLFQLEKSTNPIDTLEQIHAALKPNGLLFFVTPSTDSWSAEFLRNQWTEWRPENFYYFDKQTIQAALLRSGFAQIEISRDRRRYSLQHLNERARTSPRTLLTSMVRALCYAVPDRICRRLLIRLPSSGIRVTARRVSRRERPLLSIVLPVYNECATFGRTMEAVVAKEVPGVDKEIVVVESNSTDGTRDLVLGYQGYPGVKIVLEERPKGKGSAVRTGFKHAKGDLVLIQDADEEYDVNDYDALIEPLQTYRRAFVLGSRHITGWKIREFNDQPGIAAYFNLGHLVFTGLLNLMYGQKMKDPFTMYKVFRRDCLHDLKFECNRFDFDFELVIKLLRKGYVPLEIPVNYQARSFKEGKKVSPLRDPFTWIRALAKYRFSSIYIDPEQQEQLSEAED